MKRSKRSRNVQIASGNRQNVHGLVRLGVGAGVSYGGVGPGFACGVVELAGKRAGHAGI